MRHIPLLLIWSRAVTGVVLVVLAMAGAPPWLLTALYVAAFVGDIADGMIARALGVSTIGLRRLDTRADLLLLAGAVVAVLIVHDSALAHSPASALAPGQSLLAVWLPWICAYVAIWLLRNVLDFVRYRASPSYHMWSGKLWAATITVYLAGMLSGCDMSILIPIAFALYATNAAEGMLATIVLPRPMADIPTLWHAVALAKVERAGAPAGAA